MSNSKGRPPKTRAEKCGTPTGYTQGCRCAECRAAVAAYRREYNARPEVQNREALKWLRARGIDPAIEALI